MRNKGINTHRFRNNPTEKLFAKKWDEINTSPSGKDCILEFILATDANHPKGETSDRDREVAASVIQWLGSPVGQIFIRTVQKEVTE